MDTEDRAARGMSWAAWSLAAAFTCGTVALLGLNFSTRSPTGTATGRMEFVSGVGYLMIGTMGLVILRRRPGNRAGWAALVASVLLAFGALASEYATYGALTEPGGVPGVRWVGWLGAWTWWSGAGFGLAFVLLLSPDGSLPSARWRWVAWLALVDVVVLGMLHALTPGPLDGEYSIVVSPVGVDGARAALRSLRDLGWLLLLANGVLGTAALVVRARSMHATTRRPLWWLVAGGGACLAATLLWGVARDRDDGPSTAVQVVVGLGLLAIPLAMGLASAQTAALRRSIERLVAAREEERLRIRRDLHDGLGPTLAGVALQLDLARTLVRSDPMAVEGMLDRLTGQVHTAVGDIRQLVDGLRPPVLDQLGLVPALEQSTSYLSRHGEGPGFAVSVVSSGDFGRLPPAVEVSAFRIVMEAVTNALRHGKASRCDVRLALGPALEITVEDDGVGIPPDHVAGVGLASMRERTVQLAGSCRFESRPGGGTVVRVKIPVGRDDPVPSHGAA